MSLDRLLAARSARTPTKPALVEARRSGRDRVYRFAELDARARAYAAGLRRYGVERHDRVLMLMRPDFEWLAVVFALFARGAIPVFIDPKVGTQALLDCVRQSRANVLLAEPAALLIRRIARRSFASVDKVIVRRSLPLSATVDLGRLRAAAAHDGAHELPRVDDPDELALVAFTSGSTGAPKGVEWTHRNLHGQADALLPTFDLTTEDVGLCTLPFLAVLGCCAGTTVVLPEMDFGAPASADPRHLRDVIVRRQVSYGFASPALWANLARDCEAAGLDLDPLRVAVTGGAAPTLAQVAELRRVLPSGDVMVTYGATEALLISSISGAELVQGSASGAPGPARLRGVRAGRGIAGTEIAVVRPREPSAAPSGELSRLPTGAVGEVAVRGPVVSPRYLDGASTTRASKIPSAEAPAMPWHRTGDAGYLDERGELWLCGRLTHRTHAAGRTFDALCAEAVFVDHPAVDRCCLVNTEPDARASGPEPLLGLAVQLRPRRRREFRAIAAELITRAREHDIPIAYVACHPGPMPVDRRHNAKLDRRAVARWAARHPRARQWAGSPERS